MSHGHQLRLWYSSIRFKQLRAGECRLEEITFVLTGRAHHARNWRERMFYSMIARGLFLLVTSHLMSRWILYALYYVLCGLPTTLCYCLYWTELFLRFGRMKKFISCFQVLTIWNPALKPFVLSEILVQVWARVLPMFYLKQRYNLEICSFNAHISLLHRFSL